MRKEKITNFFTRYRDCVKKPSRRDFIIKAGGGLAGALLPLSVNAQTQRTARAGIFSQEETTKEYRKRNLSGFRAIDWRDHFETLENNAIVVDIDSRILHFWSEDEVIYKLYPSSVPSSPDLTRRGLTKIIKKRTNPSWRPTRSMKKENPNWPDFVPPGPDNPLGTHALYLSWQYYRIHGTHDVRKIGRASSSGCIGLFNEHIAELFDLTKIGTQVLIL